VRPILRYGLIGVGAFVLFLIVQLPAARVYPVIAQKRPLPVQLYALGGTVWHGRADVATAGDLRVEDLSWQVRPFALALGRLETRLSFVLAGYRLHGTVGRRIGGPLYLHDVSARLPLSQIEPIFTRADMGLEGEIALELDEAEVVDHAISVLRGRFTVTNAAVGAPLNLALGSYVMDLTSEGGTVHGVLRDGGGPLRLEGVVTLKPDGSYQLTAKFAARDTNRPELIQTLNLVGTPGPGGTVTVSRTGRLPLAKLLAAL
jgi:general secretion pathway protein N